jgi:hypothetical protein
MAEYMLVNGSRIERTFFEENVAEARSYKWERKAVPDGEHQHCLVCTAAIGAEETALSSGGHWLCAFCFQNYIENKPAQ